MEQLWNKLTEQGLYTKSFGEFKRKYNNVDGVANLHSKLVEMGLYTKSEDELINQYGFDIPKQVEGKVPDGTGPKHNADWEAVKASYMPSPLKHVDMSLPADHSHDEEQVTEAVADPNYFMQVADEATSIEDMYAVTDEEKASISETAESTYSAYTQLEESYDNITDKDKTNESQLKEEYNKYLDNALGVKAGGSKRLSYEEWVQTKIDLVNSGAYNTMPERVTPAIQWAVDKGFEGLPSQIDANYNLNKNNYFNQKLTIAKRRWLKENNYDLDTPEGQAALEQLKDVTLAHIESDKVQATDAGGTSLSTVFNSIPNDDPEFKQAVVDTEARTERNAVIRGKAANIANELDKSGTAQEGASLLGGLLFDQSKEQVDLAEKAERDLWNIEQTARKKSLEGDVLFQQYNESFDKITKTSNDLDKILPPEYKGDPVARIDDIKSQYDLTTQEGVDAANEEITTFINAYEPLAKSYQEEHQTLQDLSLSVSQIRDELGDLSIREQDLDAFTNQIGKNHRLATQMANAFAQNTVDLAQGAADLVYMVNPLGALADELIDYAGEDSYIGTVVETARVLTAPVTGGVSLYSGKRRDDIKNAVDGYQEHVNSMVAEPLRYEDIDSVGSAIEWGLVAGATQAPQLALLMATGGTSGLVMMGGMAAGQKYSAMEDQRELYKKTGGLYGQDHNFATMYAASLASGAIESLSEKVTLGLMKGTGGVASNLFFKQQGKDAASTFFRRYVTTPDKLKYAGKRIIDISEEGGSETLATIGGNYIDYLAGDKTVNLLSGVEESFVTGALIGSTISMPNVFRDIHSSFKSVETSEVLDANYQRIQEQNAILNKAKEGSPEYIAAKDLIEQLVEQNAAAIAIDVKRVDSLKDPEKKRLVEIETENRKLVQQAQEIAQSDMSKAEQESQGQALADRYNNNIQEKNDIITQYPADQVLRDHRNELQRLQDQADAIEAEGGAPVNVTRAKSKTNEALVVEFDAWKKQAEAKGNVRIAASEDGSQIYGAMVPVLNDAGEVVSYEMFFNEKNIFEDGKTTTASHELLHAAVFNTIRANPVMRRRFGEAVERILDGPGVKINEEARKDLERVKRYSKTARGEEMLAIVSEQMVKGNITIDAGAVGRMKDLVRRTSMSITDTDIQFNDDTDVRNFLKDYSRSRRKGINDKRITSLFVQGAKGKLVTEPTGREEARKIVEEAYEEQAIEDYENTLAASIRETPDLRQEFDQLVKNEDGTPKFATNQDFRNQGSPEAYLKIMDTPLLDGLIQQGMTERGLPPAALRDFTYKVKENIGFRLLKNYDVTKNDSLFGWLTGVSGGRGESIIYRAKGDVMNQYKKDGELETVSLDAPIGETTSFEATIEAETDALMQQLEEMDITRTREEREARKPKKVVNELNIDNKGRSTIKQAVVDANISLEGVQYKDVKKLTTGKNAPLSNVLNVVAEKFGVDPKRIVKPSDLNSKQRTAAQSFINNNAEFLLEMLPEGETVSGEATGVANTKLGELYEKGERLKFKDGATAAGKFSQQKRSDVTVEQFKELFGIRPDGTFDNNRKHDGAIKALVNQTAVLSANQALRENAMENGTSSEAVIAKLGEGRAEVMFSIKVPKKVKNTFDQLYPDFIKAVAASNTGDVDSIRVAAEAVYGEVLSESAINRLVNEVYDQADEYNSIQQNLKGVGVDVPLSLEQFLQDKYEGKNVEKGILKALEGKLPKDKNGKTIRIGTHFLDAERINKQRSIPGLLVAEARKQGYSDKQIAEMLIAHAAPMFSGASKIADGRLIVQDGVVIEDPNWKPTRINKKGQEVPQKNRKQAFQNVPDYIAVLNTLGLGKIEKAGKGYTLDGAALDTTLIPETSEARLKDPRFEEGKKQAEDARVVTKMILDSLYAKANDPNSSYDYADFAMTLTSLGSSMQAPMRRAALFEYFMEGVEDVVANRGSASIGSVTEFEHLKPQEEAIGEIIHSYLTTGKLDMRIFEGGGPYRPYKTGVISKSMDNAVTKAGHKFTSPRKERGDSRQYSLEAIGDTDIRSLRSIDPAKKGTKKEFVGREWVQMNDAIARGDEWFSHKIAQGIWSNISFSKRVDNESNPKGASVWDFDDTLATTKSNVLYTAPDGTKGKLTAEEYARDYVELAAQGYEFDFSEFNKVVGGQPGPLFNEALERAKKFGLKDQFVLTARPPAAQEAIYEFLKGVGLEIPAKNIIGLGNSTGQAKANWIAENLIKNGYNNLAFADDALQNVEAVKAMFDLFDIKGKVQQAKIEFSKRAPKEMENIINEKKDDLDSDFNTMLEESRGIGKQKRFSAAKARQRGKNKGKFKFFIPPSADDFAGLMYYFMGKGKTGDKHHKWFKENLFDPFSKGIRHLNGVKQAVANDLKQLRSAMPEVRKKLGKKLKNTEYTHADAIRIYNWDRAGFDVPGLSETDKKTIIREINADAQLKAFADGVNSIGNMPGGIVEPGEHWLGGTIASDMTDALENARATFLQPWKDNVDIIFNEANLNKIEAEYGSNFREALEDILFRMEHGGNRSRGAGRLLNNFTSWIHGSIGTTMFFNARSAILQMISNVNFINWSDNNMLKAAGAFANQPQYWKDVAMIFNSPFLKQRRAGLQTDVNAAELLAQIKDSKNKMKAATAYLLQLGFTPTQIADSLAIATGGATMYRNRTKTYVKEGMSQKDAESKAFEDMMEIAEETQQSAREDRISQQQASPLGKFILAFQNTPMQYNRLIKKAAMDLVNGRGDWKTNTSKIVYYGAIQNVIFYGLQQALFAALFGDDEEDELTDKKKERIINGMMDTLLRGAGIGGAVVSTIKNVILKFAKESEKMDDTTTRLDKDGNVIIDPATGQPKLYDNFFTDPDWGNVVIEALNISPPIGIKARKIYSGLKTWEYNNDVINHMSKTDIDNPIYDAVFSGTEAVTNLPLSRLYNKFQNISEAMDSDHETWKRVAMLLGWSKWSFGIKNQDVMTAKNELKEIKEKEKEEKKEKNKRDREIQKAAEEEVEIEDNLLDQDERREQGAEEVQCAAVSRSGKRCSNMALPGKNFCTIHESVPQQDDEVQCSHIKDNGERCKMKTKNKSGKCYYHD